MIWAFVVTSIGCYYRGDVAPDPALQVAGPARAAEAIALAEARLGFKAQPVYWYGKAAMACPDGVTFHSPVGCVYGITGGNGSIVSWDESSPASATPLGHELVHQARWDDDHADLALWGETRGGDDYEAGTVVGDLNAALMAAGL